jgi:hypothetical protein
MLAMNLEPELIPEPLWGISAAKLASAASQVRDETR